MQLNDVDQGAITVEIPSPSGASWRTATATTPQEQLDLLAELRDRRNVVAMEFGEYIAPLEAERAALTAEISKRIATLEWERDAITAQLDEQITALEGTVKAAVLRLGATLRGSRLMAVWNKARITWDTTKLDGYAVAHPEILTFRKESEPSVTIRACGK